MYRIILKLKNLIPLFVVLFVMPVYTQVVIRDTIYSGKDNDVKLLEEAQCLQLRAVFFYSGNLILSQSGTLKIIGCTGTSTQTITETTGGWSSLIETNPYSGSFNIKAEFYPESNQTGLATIDIYLGEAKIATRSANYGCGINGCTSASVLQTDVTLYDQLTLTPQEGSIYHGDSEYLTKSLTAHSCYENAIWHNSSNITLEIIEGSELGTFADNAGNVLGNSVTTTLANLNNTRFLANGRQPCEIELVKIRAFSGCVSMISQFYVEKTASPALSIGVDHTEIRPLGTGGTTTAIVTVTTTNCGPVSGVPVTLTVQPVDYSGGHDHTNTSTRPKGTLDHSTGTTDTNGIFTAIYTASEFGGKEKIIVTSIQTNDVKTAEVTIKIAGLSNFDNIQTNIWNLVGNSGTTNTSDCPGHAIEHSNNHYFLDNRINTLQNILVKFYAWTGTEEGGGHYLKLGINDMSLENGGLFDICGNWQSPIKVIG